MEIEFEAKFYPVEKKKIREKLGSIGAKLEVPERIMQRIIVDSVNHPQFKCHYIRIRDEGNLVRLSAKIHARTGGKLSDQKELDVVVSDFDRMKGIIESMGLEFDTYQETKRETWILGRAEIVIDTWPGLSTYVEIEAKSEREVEDIAKKLGFDWKKKIITSVKPIYMKVYGLDKKTVENKIANLTFENNPFRNLTKKWNG